MIAARAVGDTPIEILEAGCGRAWSLELPGVRYRLTGVDLDVHALEARRVEIRDLDEVVVGDLRTVSLGVERFDVIFCSFVLEHVAGVRTVLDNFARWLRPGGLLVIRVPDRDSAFGFVARTTPHWFHVAVWRYVHGYRDAGKPGHAPYPTYYDPILGVGPMSDYCREKGLHLCEVLAHYGLVGSVARKLAQRGLTALAGVSMGRLAGSHNNLTFLIEKPGLDPVTS